MKFDMARKIITDEDKQNIIFLYQSHTGKEISILMGISMHTVYKVIHENGIIKKNAHRRVDVQGIVEDYKNGFTDIKFLCKKYNCCRRTIFSALKGAERQKKHVHKPNKKELDILSDLNKMSVTRESMAEIARRYGVSRQYVHRIKNQMTEGK